MNSNQHLEIGLSEYGMYPPLRGGDKEIRFMIDPGFGEKVQVGYNVGGKPGPFKGVEIVGEGSTGRLTLKKDFIANYTGTWPAELNITAAVGQLAE